MVIGGWNRPRRQAALEGFRSGAFEILNALEDARVERLMGERYPGARLNIGAAFGFVSERAKEHG